MISQDIISENDFLDIIINKLKNNLDRFQKCPIIHQKFRKRYQNITEEDNQFVLDILDRKVSGNSFPLRTVQQLKSEIIIDEIIRVIEITTHHLIESVIKYIIIILINN